MSKQELSERVERLEKTLRERDETIDALKTSLAKELNSNKAFHVRVAVGLELAWLNEAIDSTPVGTVRDVLDGLKLSTLAAELQKAIGALTPEEQAEVARLDALFSG